MKVKVIRQGSSYVIPILENTELELDSFYVEIDPSLEAMLLRIDRSDTLVKLRKLNDALGGDDYLSFKLKHLPENYSHTTSRSDDDILADALMEKYGK
ncbi:hypothetical protein LZ24_00533 [Desulfobotulus alkaliphilus]|uniref:Uncharacterized protein n=1 Tax=Desulfobotulus alkaliphilus TaxID=622671 RepID=A0A562S6B0_9BACT|nr:hypothetical protein [Desulfobotulus alkaliphilus]TWI76911.1 hypothetical protein LZ24_00533 [Desulfobotulus alkaliphilus]